MSSSAIKAGRAFVEVGILDRVDAGLSRVQAKINQFGSWVTGAGAKMLGIGTAGAAAFIPTIKAASDAQEAWNKFQAVFGPLTQAANSWATSHAQAVNRAKGDIRSAMSTYQAFFVGMGFGRKQALGLSEQITSLALDLASFHNIADDDAIGRMIAALSGSSEVLDQFGINIKQAALEAELLKKGMKWSGASESEKTLARIAVIARALTQQGALGDAEKTSGSFANRLKGLEGAAKDLSTTVGSALLPPVTALVDKFTVGIRLADEFAKNHTGLIQSIAAGAAAVAGTGASMIGLGAATRVASFGLSGVRVAMLPFRSAGSMLKPLTGGLAAAASQGKATRGILSRLGSVKLPGLPSLGLGGKLAGAGAAISGAGSRAAGLGGRGLAGAKSLWNNIMLPRRSLDSLSLGKRLLVGMASPLLMIGEAGKITAGGFRTVGKELGQQFPKSAKAVTASARGTMTALRGLTSAGRLVGRGVRTGASAAAPLAGKAGSMGIQAMTGGASMLGGLLKSAGGMLMSGGLAAAGALLSPTGLLIAGAGALTAAIIASNGGISSLQGGLQTLVGLTGGLGTAATTAFDSWRTNGTAAVAGITTYIEAGDYAAAWDLGVSGMSASWAATVDAFSSYWSPFVAGFETQWQSACDLFDEGVAGLKEIFGPAISWLGEKWNELTSAFIGNDGLSSVALTWADVSASVATVLTNTWYGIQDTFNNVTSGLKSGWSTMTEFLVDKWFSATGWIQKAFVKLRGMFDKSINVEAEIKRIDQEQADRKAANADMGKGQQDGIAQAKAARTAEIEKNRSDVTKAIEERRDQQRNAELANAEKLKNDAAEKAKLTQQEFDDKAKAAAAKRTELDAQKLQQSGLANGGPGASDPPSVRAAGQKTVQLATVGSRVGLAQQQFGAIKPVEETAKNTGKMVEEQKKTNKQLEQNSPAFT